MFPLVDAAIDDCQLSRKLKRLKYDDKQIRLCLCSFGLMARVAAWSALVLRTGLYYLHFVARIGALALVWLLLVIWSCEPVRACYDLVVTQPSSYLDGVETIWCWAERSQADRDQTTDQPSRKFW